MTSPSNGSSRRRLRWPRVMLLAFLLPTLSVASGCTYFILLGYLIGGPPTVQPDFDKMTKKSLTDRGVKVAVVCFAPDEIRLSYTGVDKDIAKYTANQLFKKSMKVVHPDQVQDWLDKHGEWDKPGEIGEATGATHIIFIDVHKYSLFAPNSHELFQGHAEVLVSVFKMQEGEGAEAEKIYTKELTSRFPLEIPRPMSEVSYNIFRQQYLSRLSEEIGRLFYEYNNGDDITDVN
jgi:hypothetical protein